MNCASSSVALARIINYASRVVNYTQLASLIMIIYICYVLKVQATEELWSLIDEDSTILND
jgi:hypothetical protein